VSALPARAATAGSLALALALGLPAAALADPGEQDRGRSQAAQERNEDRDDERGRSESAPHGAGSEQKKAARSEGESTQEQDGGTSSQGASGEGRPAGSDPRGNNGTVKIDGEAFDDGRGNEPHVGCTFQVDFYGFDAGDTARLTFTGQAPTGGGLLHSESRTISTDPAGGGQDRDASVTYSVDDQLSELRSLAPHPQQGWHVKLAVDVDSAPGGAKQKVFWIDCPAAAAPAGTTTGTSTSVSGTTNSPATGGGTTTTTPPTSGTVSAQGAGSPTLLPATVVSGTTVAAAERREARALGSGSVALAAGTSAATGAGQVSGQGSVAPSLLPFTGSAVLLYLLGLGLSALGVGAVAHRAGRQRVSLR
jgi:hypothetical protein